MGISFERASLVQASCHMSSCDVIWEFWIPQFCGDFVSINPCLFPKGQAMGHSRITAGCIEPAFAFSWTKNLISSYKKRKDQFTICPSLSFLPLLSHHFHFLHSKSILIVFQICAKCGSVLGQSWVSPGSSNIPIFQCFYVSLHHLSIFSHTWVNCGSTAGQVWCNCMSMEGKHCVNHS